MHPTTPKKLDTQEKSSSNSNVKIHIPAMLWSSLASGNKIGRLWSRRDSGRGDGSSWDSSPVSWPASDSKKPNRAVYAGHHHRHCEVGLRWASRSRVAEVTPLQGIWPNGKMKCGVGLGERAPKGSCRWGDGASSGVDVIDVPNDAPHEILTVRLNTCIINFFLVVQLWSPSNLFCPYFFKDKLDEVIDQMLRELGLWIRQYTWSTLKILIMPKPHCLARQACLLGPSPPPMDCIIVSWTFLLMSRGGGDDPNVSLSRQTMSSWHYQGLRGRLILLCGTRFPVHLVYYFIQFVLKKSKKVWGASIVLPSFRIICRRNGYI